MCICKGPVATGMRGGGLEGGGGESGRIHRPNPQSPRGQDRDRVKGQSRQLTSYRTRGLEVEKV